VAREAIFSYFSHFNVIVSDICDIFLNGGETK